MDCAPVRDDRDLIAELRDLESRSRRRCLRTVRGRAGRSVELNQVDVVNFSSNNYLGLADHPALIAAAVSALQSEGLGATASRLIVGNHNLHEQLEQALARFQQRPAARLFNSGYNANVGTLQALARPGDIIFSDHLNHASLIDGCRLSRARVCVYPHNDVDRLRDLLGEHQGQHRFVVTDSVFSMDGDRAPLTDLAALCRDRRATLIVDEAHALGVLGPGGRGLAAELGLQPEAVVAPLGKAFGSFGAFVAGSAALADVLLNRARSFIFTTALPPSIAAANLAALCLIEGPEGEERRTRLALLIRRFAAGLAQRGLLAPAAGTTTIFPLHVGDDTRAMECCEYLLKRGLYAQGIRPPTVPPGTARLRFSLMATHTDEDIDRALASLDELSAEGLLPPPQA